MRDEEDFNPERFRLTPEQQAELGAASKPKAKRRRRDKFVQVPGLWIEQLCAIRAHGSTYRVAMHLLHEAWRTDSRVVKLTNVALAEVGVGRKGKALALSQLRRAGLVAVEQRPRRSPIVTVRFRD
jgi:ribosomal protein L20